MTKLISYEELRQQLLADPASEYAKFIEKVAQHHPALAGNTGLVEVQMPMAMYLFKTTKRGGEVTIAGVPCVVMKWNEVGHADLAVQTSCEDVFFIMEKADVIINYNLAMDLQSELPMVQYALLPSADAQWIVDEIARLDKPEEPKKRPGLSLVVNNVDTVETLGAKPVLKTVQHIEQTDSEVSAEDILGVLRASIGQRFMPTSTLKTYGKQKHPVHIKAADDGDFTRQLLASNKSGLFKRDALRSEEVYAVLNMHDYNIIVGLKQLQVFVGALGGTRMYQWVPQSTIDVTLLLMAVNDL